MAGLDPNEFGLSIVDDSARLERARRSEHGASGGVHAIHMPGTFTRRIRAGGCGLRAATHYIIYRPFPVALDLLALSERVRGTNIPVGALASRHRQQIMPTLSALA